MFSFKDVDEMDEAYQTNSTPEILSGTIEIKFKQAHILQGSICNISCNALFYL